MAIPANDSAWPPEQMKAAYDAIRFYDAWLVGDPNTLQATMAAAAPKGGLFGRLRLPFWGSGSAPLNGGNVATPPAKVHVPVAANISRMSADQVYGEMFTAVFVDDHDSDDQTSTDNADPEAGDSKPQSAYDKATARLAELLDDIAHTRFSEAGELASAHGGAYMKVVWDDTVDADKPMLMVVGADVAIPTFRFGKLISVAFWTKLTTIAKSNYMLIEDHQPGYIEYALFESNAMGQIGQRVPLTSHPEALTYAAIVNEQSLIETGSDLLTAVYLPNRRPNPKFRKDPVGQNLGRSDYDGLEDLMDTLDSWYTSFDRDYRLGRARMMVPKGLLQLGLPGQGATFNSDQEFFVEMGETVGTLNTSGTGTTDSFLKESQPQIRYQEHLGGIEHLYQRIYIAAGFSPSSFGEDGATALTATEVASREKLTLATRAAKILSATPAIILLLAAMLDVDQRWFGGPGRSGLFPVIEWPDAVGENPLTEAQTLQALNLSESTSIFTRVSMLHSEWDDVQVLEEVDRIRNDLRGGLPDPSERVLWNALGGPTSGQVAATAAADDGTSPSASDAETGAKTPPAIAGEPPKK